MLDNDASKTKIPPYACVSLDSKQTICFSFKLQILMWMLLLALVVCKGAFHAQKFGISLAWCFKKHKIIYKHQHTISNPGHELYTECTLRCMAYSGTGRTVFPHVSYPCKLIITG